MTCVKASGVTGENSDSFPTVQELEEKKRGIRCAVYRKIFKISPENTMRLGAAKNTCLLKNLQEIVNFDNFDNKKRMKY